MIADINIGGGWWRFKLVYNGPTGVSEIQNESFVVYPNPATDYIMLNNASQIAMIQIYSVSGTLVYESRQVEGSIDISSLASGFYTIQAQNKEGQVSQAKFIVK